MDIAFKDKRKIYELSQSYIRFDFKADDQFKSALEKYLLYKGKEYSKRYYNKELIVDGLYFTVELEEGSLKSRLKIFGQISILLVSGYGGLRSGIDYLIEDSQSITESIVRDIQTEQNIDPNSIGRVERRLGVPGQLKRLYQNIDKLSSRRQDLTDREQQELISKIRSQYEDLILVLDQPATDILERDLQINNIPTVPLELPPRDDEYMIHRYAIREEELRLISEDEIDEIRYLPPPR